MRAAVFDRTGPPEVLRLAELPTPSPGPGQLRVRVHTAGVQPYDALVRSGRIEQPLRFPQQIGNEFAGTVLQSVPGDGAGPSFAVGDPVLGWSALASHAEQVLVDADAVVLKPAAMTWETAGAIGASGQTALSALRALPLTAGQSLLVHGGAGGAGTAVVQIARHRGLRVLATASPAHHDALRGLGATPLPYGPELDRRLREQWSGPIDAAVSTVGGAALPLCVDLVGDPRRVATLVDHDAAARLGVVGVRATRSRAQLTELARLHGRGALRVPIRSRYPLARIRDAHHDIESGHGHGKILIDVA